jgi:hypothetical protein
MQQQRTEAAAIEAEIACVRSLLRLMPFGGAGGRCSDERRLRL